jgi:hypothetical protein
VQFGLAFFAVVIVGRSLVGDADAETVLPDFAQIALNEQAIGFGLVIVNALVLLVAADATRDLVFGIADVVHRFVDHAVVCGVGIVRFVEIGVGTSLKVGV